VKRKPARPLTLLIFTLALAFLPPTSSAQDLQLYPDYGSIVTGGSTGGGSCDFCDLPQCGCDPGTFSIGIVLVEWVCMCDNSQPQGICMQTCWYEPTY